MKKTLFFSAMLFAAVALCSCGGTETAAVSEPAPALASSDVPADDIAEHLDAKAAYVCETEEYRSLIRFDPSSHLIEGVDGPPDSDNLLYFKGTYSLEGRGLTISYQFLHDSSHSTYQTSYSVRFLTDGISLTPLGYVDGIFQGGASGTKDFILSSDWTASSLHELCAEDRQESPLNIDDKLRSLIAGNAIWVFTLSDDTIYLAFLDDMFLAYRCRADSSPVYACHGYYEISGKELSIFYMISSDPDDDLMDAYEFKVGETTFSLWYSEGDFGALGGKQKQGRLFRPDDTWTCSDLLEAVKATFENEGGA